MKYTVSLVGYVGKSVEVEADDWEAAVDAALESDESYFGLCHHCAREWDPGEVEAQAVYDEDDKTVAESKWHPTNLVEVDPS